MDTSMPTRWNNTYGTNSMYWDMLLLQALVKKKIMQKGRPMLISLKDLIKINTTKQMRQPKFNEWI